MRYSTARVVSWVLGVRVLEADSTHIVMRVPNWFSYKVLDAVVASVVDEFSMTDAARRRNVRVTTRGRIVRVDADPKGDL